MRTPVPDASTPFSNANPLSNPALGYAQACPSPTQILFEPTPSANPPVSISCKPLPCLFAALTVKRYLQCCSG